CCALALLLVGCEKKSSKQASAPLPISETVASDSPTAQVQAQPIPQAPVVAPVSQTQVPPPVQPVVVDTTANTTAVLAQLTQALRKFSFEHRRVPKSFSEVAGAGYVSAMPQAPPGKQFAVDVKRVEVVLVKQ